MSQSASASLRAASAAVRLFRLPFGRQSWRGAQGNWLGTGLGSSIDYRDQRVYAPGDDPRYIHWSAYARTGQLTMKLYRAEVAPMVDIAVDTSPSMTFDSAKAERTNELLAFCVQSAVQTGASVRVHAFTGDHVTEVPTPWLHLEQWRAKLPQRSPTITSRSAMPSFLPWRANALKVLISDLLFAGEPATLLGPLASGTGLALVLAPALASEGELVPRGNIELHDCEGPAKRAQLIDQNLAVRYRAAYLRHFELWRDAARLRGALFANVVCEGFFNESLAGEPLRRGLVEHQT